MVELPTKRRATAMWDEYDYYEAAYEREAEAWEQEVSAEDAYAMAEDAAMESHLFGADC